MSKDKSKSKLENVLDTVRSGQSQYSEDDWSNRLSSFLCFNGIEGNIIDIKRPAGGASAASVIFSVQTGNKQDETVHRYVARLKPDSSFWLEFNTVEQFRVQQALFNAGLPVPEPCWLDEHGNYLGRPGYIMEFTRGESASAAYFTDGPLANVSLEKRFRMLRNMIDALANFHNKADLNIIKGLVSKGKGNSWVEREINLWFDLMANSRPELVPLYQTIRDWLVDTAPDTTAPVVLHGDYQASNVLWAGEDVSTILDFEVVRIGPRESDIAYQCISDENAARFYGELDIELPSMAQRASWYEQACGVKLENLDYHFMRAVFQLACGVASLTGTSKQDLTVKPTPYMDFLNRRLLGLLPEFLPFEVRLPVINP